jgi:hypothetical protein
MNIIDLRNKLLQSSTERRISSDRRKISYSFNSSEWLEYMKNNKLECPTTEERRKIIRRGEDKEESIKQDNTSDSPISYRRIFLTSGERKLLQDIYLTDFNED